MEHFWSSGILPKICFDKISYISPDLNSSFQQADVWQLVEYYLLRSLFGWGARSDEKSSGNTK
jgi:hypothetical protein